MEIAVAVSIVVFFSFCWWMHRRAMAVLAQLDAEIDSLQKAFDEMFDGTTWLVAGPHSWSNVVVVRETLRFVDIEDEMPSSKGR